MPPNRNFDLDHDAGNTLDTKITEPRVQTRLCLAEKQGFEPWLRFTRTTPLAGEPLRPLGYFSVPKLFCLHMIAQSARDVNILMHGGRGVIRTAHEGASRSALCRSGIIRTGFSVADFRLNCVIRLANTGRY